MSTTVVVSKKPLSSDSNPENKTIMKGLVYSGSGNIGFKDIPKPSIEKPTDALVRIMKTIICGTD